jgi:small multidrug resistance pump
MQWLFLSIAIISEVIATSALKSSNGFTQLWPSLVVVAGYAAAFFFLSLTLRTIPVGAAYAIWSGAGIVLVTLIAWLAFGQTLDSRYARTGAYRRWRNCPECVFQVSFPLTYYSP